MLCHFQTRQFSEAVVSNKVKKGEKSWQGSAERLTKQISQPLSPFPERGEMHHARLIYLQRKNLLAGTGNGTEIPSDEVICLSNTRCRWTEGVQCSAGWCWTFPGFPEPMLWCKNTSLQGQAIVFSHETKKCFLTEYKTVVIFSIKERWLCTSAFTCFL